MKEYSIDQLFKMDWHELKPKEISALIVLSNSIVQHDPESEEYGLQVISILRILRKNKTLVGKIDVRQAVDCFNSIDFFKRDAKGNFLKPWYFFPVRSFNFQDVSFEYPQMNGTLPMYDRTFDQLIYADSAFSAFCLLNQQYNHEKELGNIREARNIELDINSAIHNLIAVLYTPKEKFDIAQIEVNARMIPLSLNAMEQTLILHTYANIRKFLVERCQHLFPKPPEDAPASSPQLTGPMWMNLRFELANTNAFSGLQTTRNANIYDAIDFLDNEAKKRETEKTNV